MQNPRVITAQPGSFSAVHPMTQAAGQTYTVGLCDCFHSCAVCACVTFCGPFAACRASTRLGENCCYPLFFGILPISARFRTLTGIQQSMCQEGCEALWCGHCFMCRLLNEQAIRGYD